MKKKIITKNQQETIQLATRLGRIITKPTTILMFGDLGAGKTTFTKGLAIGLDIVQQVNSPTFTILKIYQGRLPLYHIDAYRLEGIHQDLGFEEYLEDSDGVTVVEWPMYIEELWPKEYIKLTITNDDENRVIEIENNGYEELVKEWLCD